MQASAGCAASSCKSLWLTGSSLPCEAVPLWTTLDLRRAAEGRSEHIAEMPTTRILRNIEGEKQPQLLAQRCRGTLLSDVILEDCEPRVWNTAPRRESGRSSAPTGDRQVTIPTFSCGPVIGSPPHHPPLSCGPVSGVVLFFPESGVVFSHTHFCAFLCIRMHSNAFYCILRALRRAAFYKSVTF